jgi:gliding motility-associated-like protein
MPAVSKASHVSGGEVNYTSLGGNQYKVQLILYWDCASFDPGTTALMTATNTCGLATVNFTVNLDTAYEVSQVCPSSVSSTRCNGGTLPGNKKNVYSAIVTLPGACSVWTFEHTSCCRNVSNNVPSQPSYTFYATLNNLVAPDNNSPYFTSQPLPYMCVGQPVCYSPGVVELDGHTLTFSFVDAMNTNSTTPVPYGGGFSGSSPMPGITIDPTTGLISFTPTTVGNFVVSFLVVETNSSGVVIGSVIRDIQMVVVNCSNQVVACNSGGITNLVGFGATATGPNSMQICENIPFTFNISFTDPDAANILSYTSNILQVLPGATISSSGSNPITISVGWTAPPGSANTNTTFALTVADNACPVTGQQTVNYIIDVLAATNAGPDFIKCGTQAVQLNGNGPGTVFNWSVLSGPPMVVGTNFSCNPCQNPLASPNATTTYLLTCNGGSGCVITDTVTVFVVPNFSYTATQSSSNSCLQDPVQLDVTGITPAGAYTFQWSPATYLSNANIPNPTATFISAGTYTYTLTVVSPAGCTQTSTLSIVAAPAFSPVIIASNDTSFCGGGTVNLGVGFAGGSVPPTCGLSAGPGCGGASISGVVGTGTTSNTATTWPAIFGNWYTSTKHQMLFRASELNAAGILGGKIDQLDFMVTAINGISTYHQFTIRVGCTNLNALGTTWESGLHQVFNPKTVNVIVGWNTMMLDNAFEWDGISNIVVEVCSSEGPGAFGYSNYTQSSISPFTTTSFTSCLYSTTDQFDMCPDLTNWITPTTDRPNVRFHYCSMASDPTNYSYEWTPSSGVIANQFAQNTTAVPPSTMDYYITVTDINGGCSDVDTVHVDVVNINSLTVTPAGPYCVSIGTTYTLESSVPVGTGSWTGAGIIDPVLGIFDPAVAGLGTHQVIYAVNGACGTGADTMDIQITPAPDATINQVTNQCVSGSPITLSAAFPGGTWSGNGITNASTGTFDPAIAGVGYDTITYTVNIPCYSQDTMVIRVTSQLDPTITHVGPFCGTTQSILLSAVDPGGTWSGPGIVNPAAGIFDPFVAGPGQQVVYYTIAGLCGNVDTDTITVLPSPTLSISSDTTEGCEPTTVVFAGTSDQPGGTSLWSFGDPLSGINNVSNSPSPLHTYNYSGSYDITFIYANPIGCSDTLVMPAYITIHSQPVAAFSATPQPATILNPEINFIDNSTGLVDNWHWTFGFINDSSLIQHPSYTYPDTGVYAVELIVKNIHGCADTTNSYVAIDPIFTFYAPTAFSPDENGNNDVFRVYGDGIDASTFQMMIFNRWGETIYAGTKYEEGWNGAKNNTGELVGQDSYVYKITFKDHAGRKHQYIGHVTIVK